MERPNILYIHSHDTGRYVQPYGHNIPTPNIQRLAEEGVLFRQAFCAAPTCSPSRASLLTGQCAHSSGMLGLAHRGFGLSDYRQHIVHTLRQAGYQSTLVGVQHIAAEPDVIGYDRVLPVESHLVRHVAPTAIRFLDSSPPQPFFLSVGFAETHREFHTPSPSEDARFCLPPPPLPDTPETRQDMAAFKASARVLDRGIGAVLDALEANDLRENTLVICTTDHGIAFPGIKCNLTDQGIGVMLILRGPGGFQAAPQSVSGVGSAGQVCDAMVSHIDLFPTLCDLLHIEPPTWLQGKSILPLIRGEAQQIHTEIFAEVTYHAAYEPQRAVRTSRWKYIRRFQVRPGPVLPNCDDSLSKDVWLWHGWQDRPPAVEQLYDLIFDPNETHNLAEMPSMANILNQMRDRLARWMHATHDPLLGGPVPPPPGARVNDPDGLSPAEPTRVVGHDNSS
jgi:N-sulfoglucosamine sulfohydrolase